MVIDSYLKRNDVNNLIQEIKKNPKYFDKENIDEDMYYGKIGNELSLYILYDALLKFKIIIDNNDMLDEYVVQLDKLYKKIDSYNQIMVGVNKLICHMTIKLLNIRGIDNKDNKKSLIEYIYNKYIANGYYVHGFSTIYENSIKENGFISEVYTNYYQQFNDLKKIFNKYGLNELLEKDFSINKTYFTDDIVMGCYYSAMAPGYFTNILFNRLFNNKNRESYLSLDYDKSISHLKKFMINKSFSKDDMEYVIYVIKNEWDLLCRVNKKISLLLVKRSLIDDQKSTIDEYLNDSSDVYEIVDRILSSKNGSIDFDGTIDNDNIIVVSFDNFYNVAVDNINKLSIDDTQLSYVEKREKVNKEFMDVYGNVYIFLIFGSLLISLGVIITIIMVIRGI